MNERSATTFGSLGRRAVAWVILLAVAVIAIKIVISIVTGLVMTLIWAALAVMLVLGVLWALKHL